MSFTKSALYAALPTTARGVPVKLSASAKDDRIVYASGKAIIIRDLNNPGLSLAYSQHVQPTTVARFSPSGYYCASGDASGTVRVWDTVGDDQTLKGEYKVISGRINDLEWDGESKRIIAVGDGREKFGHAFMFDSGSSTGEIIGHSKAVNAVAIRHQRPYRAATAADDGSLVFHTGVPFKYEKTLKTHTKFVQDVRYAPSGDVFASVGTDGKLFLYDGKTGETRAEADAHKGSVMACAWAADSATVASAGADCTVRLWDAATAKETATHSVGAGIGAQQIGLTCLSSGALAALSTSGTLTVLDARAAAAVKTVEGAAKAITAAAPRHGGRTFLVGTAEGRVLEFDDAGAAKALEGDSHSNLVVGFAAGAGGKAVSVGWDDKVREMEGTSFIPAGASTASQPRGVAALTNGAALVASVTALEVFTSSQLTSSLKPSFTPSSAAGLPGGGDRVAVGGEGGAVYLYSWDGKELKENGKLEGLRGVVSALAWAPQGDTLAAGDSSGKITLFDVAEQKAITSRWSHHSARINALAFTPDGRHCASGSLDTHVYVWSVAKPTRNVALKNAGPGGVNAVWWLDGAKGKLASAGADACVRVWDVKFHE